MFNTTIFTLVLQRGITAAATIIMVFILTVGVGCRPLGYVLYCGIAILVLYSSPSSRQFLPASWRLASAHPPLVTVALRRFCLLLALVDATGTVVLSCLHFSKTLDN